MDSDAPDIDFPVPSLTPPAQPPFPYSPQQSAPQHHRRQRHRLRVAHSTGGAVPPEGQFAGQPSSFHLSPPPTWAHQQDQTLVGPMFGPLRTRNRQQQQKLLPEEPKAAASFRWKHEVFQTKQAGGGLGTDASQFSDDELIFETTLSAPAGGKGRRNSDRSFSSDASEDDDRCCSFSHHGSRNSPSAHFLRMPTFLYPHVATFRNRIVEVEFASYFSSHKRVVALACLIASGLTIAGVVTVAGDRHGFPDTQDILNIVATCVWFACAALMMRLDMMVKAQEVECRPITALADSEQNLQSDGDDVDDDAMDGDWVVTGARTRNRQRRQNRTTRSSASFVDDVKHALARLWILTGDPTSPRQLLRRFALYYDVIAVVAHSTCYIFGAGNFIYACSDIFSGLSVMAAEGVNILAPCHPSSFGSGNSSASNCTATLPLFDTCPEYVMAYGPQLTCRTSTQGAALLLLSTSSIIFFVPLRSVYLVPLHLFGLAVLMALFPVPQKWIPTGVTVHQFICLAILWFVQVVVALGAAIARELRSRATFRLHVERHRRSAQMMYVKHQLDAVAKVQLPEELLAPTLPRISPSLRPIASSASGLGSVSVLGAAPTSTRGGAHQQPQLLHSNALGGQGQGFDPLLTSFTPTEHSRGFSMLLPNMIVNPLAAAGGRRVAAAATGNDDDDDDGGRGGVEVLTPVGAVTTTTPLTAEEGSAFPKSQPTFADADAAAGSPSAVLLSGLAAIPGIMMHETNAVLLHLRVLGFAGWGCRSCPSDYVDGIRRLMDVVDRVLEDTHHRVEAVLEKSEVRRGAHRSSPPSQLPFYLRRVHCFGDDVCIVGVPIAAAQAPGGGTSLTNESTPGSDAPLIGGGSPGAVAASKPHVSHGGGGLSGSNSRRDQHNNSSSARSRNMQPNKHLGSDLEGAPLQHIHTPPVSAVALLREAIVQVAHSIVTEVSICGKSSLEDYTNSLPWGVETATTSGEKNDGSLRLFPIAVVVEGGAGYRLHPATKNIIAIGPALDRAIAMLLTRQERRSQVSTISDSSVPPPAIVGSIDIEGPEELLAIANDFHATTTNTAACMEEGRDRLNQLDLSRCKSRQTALSATGGKAAAIACTLALSTLSSEAAARRAQQQQQQQLSSSRTKHGDQLARSSGGDTQRLPSSGRSHEGDRGALLPPSLAMHPPPLAGPISAPGRSDDEDGSCFVVRVHAPNSASRVGPTGGARRGSVSFAAETGHAANRSPGEQQYDTDTSSVSGKVAAAEPLTPFGPTHGLPMLLEHQGGVMQEQVFRLQPHAGQGASSGDVQLITQMSSAPLESSPPLPTDARQRAEQRVRMFRRYVVLHTFEDPATEQSYLSNCADVGASPLDVMVCAGGTGVSMLAVFVIAVIDIVAERRSCDIALDFVRHHPNGSNGAPTPPYSWKEHTMWMWPLVAMLSCVAAIGVHMYAILHPAPPTAAKAPDNSQSQCEEGLEGGGGGPRSWRRSWACWQPYVVHFLMSPLPKVFFIATIYCAASATVIQDAQTIWVIMVIDFALIRPMSDGGVMGGIKRDLPLCIPLIVRSMLRTGNDDRLHATTPSPPLIAAIKLAGDATSTIKGRKSFTAIYLSWISMLVVIAIRILAELRQREVFAEAKLLDFQKEEMESDYKALEKALDATVPAGGVAERLVRRMRGTRIVLDDWRRQSAKENSGDNGTLAFPSSDAEDSTISVSTRNDGRNGKTSAHLPSSPLGMDAFDDACGRSSAKGGVLMHPLWSASGNAHSDDVPVIVLRWIAPPYASTSSSSADPSEDVADPWGSIFDDIAEAIPVHLQGAVQLIQCTRRVAILAVPESDDSDESRNQKNGGEKGGTSAAEKDGIDADNVRCMRALHAARAIAAFYTAKMHTSNVHARPLPTVPPRSLSSNSAANTQQSHTAGTWMNSHTQTRSSASEETLEDVPADPFQDFVEEARGGGAGGGEGDDGTPRRRVTTIVPIHHNHNHQPHQSRHMRIAATTSSSSQPTTVVVGPPRPSTTSSTTSSLFHSQLSIWLDFGPAMGALIGRTKGIQFGYYGPPVTTLCCTQEQFSWHSHSGGGGGGGEWRAPHGGFIAATDRFVDTAMLREMNGEVLDLHVDGAKTSTGGSGQALCLRVAVSSCSHANGATTSLLPPPPQPSSLSFYGVPKRRFHYISSLRTDEEEISSSRRHVERHVNKKWN